MYYIWMYKKKGENSNFEFPSEHFYDGKFCIWYAYLSAKKPFQFVNNLIFCTLENTFF